MSCSFCKNGTKLYVKTVQHTMPLLAPLTRAEELRQELINITGEVYIPIATIYCPMCGERLQKGENDEN